MNLALSALIGAVTGFLFAGCIILAMELKVRRMKKLINTTWVLKCSSAGTLWIIDRVTYDGKFVLNDGRYNTIYITEKELKQEYLQEYIL